MSAIANPFREGLFRNTRPLTDGRMLVRWGKYLYVMEAGELRRVQRWKTIYLAVQLGTMTIMVTTAVLWLQAVDDGLSLNLFYGALLASTASMFVDAWRTMRLKRRKQPDGDYDRLVEAWDRIG